MLKNRIIIATASANGSYSGQLTLINGMKFSEFKYVHLYLASANIILDSMMLEMSLFYNNINSEGSKTRLIYSFLNPPAYADIHAISDTQIDIRMYNLPAEGTSQPYWVTVAGIK